MKMEKNEKLLYRENTLSQQLVLLFLVGNTAFTIFHTNGMAVDYHLGIFILMNVFLSLFAFLMAVRQKVYDRHWGYAGIALAVFQIVRLGWVPPEIEGSLRIVLEVLLIVTGLLLLAASLVCIKRFQDRQKFIVENKVDLAALQK